MIRRYSQKDKIKVIDLLRRNTPKYFDPSEEQYLENYLTHELEDYFIFEENSEIIGAGGINYLPEEKLARISWDIIDLKSHGKGIGRTLIQYRLNLLSKNQDIDIVMVRTSQHAYKFYAKFGFELEKVEQDFWAKDFHLYQMKIRNDHS
ncbi:GNAT family N-acetyltransferase [Gelidibacter gilvus]|uniref:GNAT family N-acetyltransferase n=1 Tax=Gelidibacter gilvus TaxID=59602 RepID=A0A4Q0XDA4_9FLAO|nr:GNAT family N-acetyltransferase [Gelidibacter gilvus]RXJ44606.1 GNAT family N-acetyltransferase [Gelidibacter gilvus]